MTTTEIMAHIIDQHLTIDPTGIAAECTCGDYVESLGRDESSRNSISAWISEHRKLMT